MLTGVFLSQGGRSFTPRKQQVCSYFPACLRAEGSSQRRRVRTRNTNFPFSVAVPLPGATGSTHPPNQVHLKLQSNFTDATLLRFSSRVVMATGELK